jgi:DNA repair protein RadC
VSAGILMGIDLSDHVIAGEDVYFSFRDMGILDEMEKRAKHLF